MMRLLFALTFFMGNFCLAQDSIKPVDVHKAAHLLDLKYSDKEVEMMLPDLRDNIADYKKMHALTLDNSIAMSMAQRLTAENVKQEKLKWKYDKKIKLPTNRNELAFYSIHALGSLLRNKSITAVELTNFFISRLKKFGDTLQCTVSLTEQIAMEQAMKADEELNKGMDRGPLHGIPYGLKDLFAVKGTKTTWGAALSRWIPKTACRASNRTRAWCRCLAINMKS
jgi:hypothetical protein